MSYSIANAVKEDLIGAPDTMVQGGMKCVQDLGMQDKRSSILEKIGRNTF